MATKNTDVRKDETMTVQEVEFGGLCRIIEYHRTRALAAVNGAVGGFRNCPASGWTIGRGSNCPTSDWTNSRCAADDYIHTPYHHS